MLLSPRRGGRLLSHSTYRSQQLCMRCIRLQHSDAAESSSHTHEANDRRSDYSVGREQRPTRHPPRRPRTYIARPMRDVELKSFGFMAERRPKQSLQTEPIQRVPVPIERPTEPNEPPIVRKLFVRAPAPTEECTKPPIHRLTGRNPFEQAKARVNVELQKDIEQVAEVCFLNALLTL